MRTFEVMGTCSTLPRIVITYLHFEKEINTVPSTIGTLSVDLNTPDEEEIKWSDNRTPSRDPSLNRELSRLLVADIKEEEEILVFDFNNPQTLTNTIQQSKETPPRHASQELLDQQDLVVAQWPDQLHDPDLYAFVSKHQVHDCRPYCLRRRYKGDKPQPNQAYHCYFDFPFEPCPKSYFDADSKRSYYKRGPSDASISSSIPYLLKLLRVNMDIEINADRKVLSYFTKYLSKVDSDVHLHYHMETSQEHFKARMVGAVEAVYHICGWNL
ncbi:hypothetical protein G6F37_011812 [Rhizopus arrhizus]|nr:hypothetical protein G6F38_011702 [Rhizopus arrhizus]KAG1147287.1 hypothetical protein G6F37_011812 [Rhizopus arrhizus]